MHCQWTVGGGLRGLFWWVSSQSSSHGQKREAVAVLAGPFARAVGPHARFDLELTAPA